jgi:hypothetical protein
MRNLSRTTKVVVAATATVVIAAGAAFAYYTSTITGSTQNGAATVSSTAAQALTVSLNSAATNLYPGSTPQTIVVTINNPNTYYANVAGKTLTLDFANMSSGDTACTPSGAGNGNNVALFSASTASSPVASIAGLGSANVTFTNVSMADSATVDQTACIAKSFNVPVVVS